MTDDQIRSLVRDIVAHQLAGGSPAAAEPSWKRHASHGRLPVLIGQQLDGPCIIEPAVPCNHCGYCQSLGH